MVECFKAGLYWRGFMHDLSKFLPSEFIPYARYFYGKYPTVDEVRPVYRYEYTGLYREDIKRRFDRAWLKHIHRNPHHWQYWLLQEDDGPLKNIPIPPKYLSEMVADWRGAGKAISGKDDIKTWYSNNKDKINLNRINRKFVEYKIFGKTHTTEDVKRVLAAIIRE
jgi:hypothetical protein